MPDQTRQTDQEQKAHAHAAALQAVQDIARTFEQGADWIETWTPHFVGALVGEFQKPTYSADSIAGGTNKLIQTYPYRSAPKPADLTKAINAMWEERKARARATPAQPARRRDRQPERRWTPKQRARNVAFVSAINAKIEEQNADPEYIQALRTHGKGSPELAAVVRRQRTEMQTWIDQNKPTN